MLVKDILIIVVYAVGWYEIPIIIQLKESSGSAIYEFRVFETYLELVKSGNKIWKIPIS